MAANAAKPEVNISQLFSELSKNFRDEEYALAQKCANKILKEIPNDVDATKCKIVCLIQQQTCFQEAHDVIVSSEKKGICQMPFEKAYCLYRLNRLEESAAVLDVIEAPSLKEKELLAQVKYRLEDYGSCLDLYKDLIKNSADDHGDEREANMAAVIAAAKLWKNKNIGSGNMRNDTHELCYNYACLLIAQGELEKAVGILNDAENLCKKNLEADDYTEEEIEEELGIIKSQQGYINQLKGETKEALALYNHVLKGKPADLALVAVLSNNIIAIHKDKDLFDSKKRLKAVSVDSLKHKLTQSQLETIEMNKCLLYMYTNQLANCRTCIKNLQTNYIVKNVDKAAILEAAICLKDKHTDQAIEHLEGILTSGVQSNDLSLTLVQLYMTKGKYEKALEILKGLKGICYTPAIVSLCISLLNVIGKEKEAVSYLDKAITYGQNNPSEVKKEHVITFMKESSNLKLASGDIESAVKMLEVLRNEDPSEIMTVAKIVAAYSKIDLKKAQEYSIHLPALSSSDKEVNLNVLEMTDMIGSFRFSKKTIKRSLEDEESKDEQVVKKKKSRKKKRGKLPKNYNAEVDPDPERWLPRWERSTFKHKKAKRGANTVGKGTQGSVPTDQPQSPKPSSASSPKPGVTNQTATPNSPSAANVVPPRQQKPGAKPKSKKKKKGGW